ncbi:gliding motility lipoprotein GldB [Flavobacterium sp. UMI-01]|uniref:gliding motility lipoprotein GldB n=1 Tax=Flavobacterium sp. UMI-01 TaxID=1441053 RepID=UPI001C7D54D3|nr:gliding motility lipoprotein GldB [Flavobacterium sp. UMI-01]GIZ08957.1 gliding motility lipoprotein GldB [Flavobacterium sp. UMI-01]
MKIGLIALLLSLFLISCDKKTKTEKIVEKIPVEIKVERFDKAFFETEPQNLDQVKQAYPLFFPEGNDDAVWLEKMQNPLWRELYQEVQKKYGDFEHEKQDFEKLFKHIKHYFPQTKTPKVVTVIAEMDYTNKVIYTDSLVIVALEMYLGKEHRFYEFPKYLKQNFERDQMMPDVVSSFFKFKVQPNPEKSFLSKMIYAGKELYLKDKLLPEIPDEVKIGYTSEQLVWCQENEQYMWQYFIEKQLLYSDDAKLASRFVNPAPFSKFYLEIDNESPGQVGAWLGWQIVRSYMEHNEISLENLFAMNAKELFEKSKYKPKK